MERHSRAAGVGAPPTADIPRPAGRTSAYAHAETLPPSEEGYVLRFAGGLRLKAKGAACRRLHAMIARVTPLGLWDLMAAGDDLDATRRAIPEEFWWDSTRSGDCSTPRSSHASRRWQHSRPKRVAVGQGLGLAQRTLPDGPRRYLFSYRRQPDVLADNKTRATLLRDIKAKANKLSGYCPSFALQRLAEEE